MAQLAVEEADGVYAIYLSEPPDSLPEAHVFVEVADQQGNIIRVDRAFFFGAVIFADGFESGDTSGWSQQIPP